MRRRCICSATVRRRLRELGYAVGRFAPAERNALVDVPGVLVGHRTLADGERLRTGVTAILPHGDNLYIEKVLGACHVVNGYGKAAGLSQLDELGTVESPILLTSTLSVGPVREGGVGAGTGTTCFGYKAGIGGASRRTGSHVLGCLVCSNYGSRRDLHLLVGPVSPGEGEAPPEPPAQGGSIMIVVGPDAPLSERQPRRLAARASFGLGRAGSFATNASGEYVVAFSTAHRVPHRSESPELELRLLRDDAQEVRDLFEAAAEVVHEAVLNSLCSADATTGRDGHSVEAFPYELLAHAPGVRLAQ